MFGGFLKQVQVLLWFCSGFHGIFFHILLMFGEKNIRVCEDVNQQYWNVGIEPP